MGVRAEEGLASQADPPVRILPPGVPPSLLGVVSHSRSCLLGVLSHSLSPSRLLQSAGSVRGRVRVSHMGAELQRSSKHSAVL